MQDNTKLVQAIELQQQGKMDEATQLFWEVLATDPGNGPALYSLSLIALNAGNRTEALRISEQGVNVAPLFFPLHLIHGAVLQALGRKEESLQSYDKALEINPDYVEALSASGVLLRDMLRHIEAVERFNHILTFEPDNTQALANCGILLTEFKQSEQAIGMFKRLIRINPDYDYALGLLAYEQLHICDWTDFELLSRKIVDSIKTGHRACKSLAFMSFSDSAEDQQRVAKLFAESYCPKRDISYWQGERYHHKKIRLAYISPDLREHPVGHLMAGVFEHHDKTRFELTAISLGIDDGSRLRARMLKSFDHFIEAQQMNASQIAQILREMEIDIAVDLSGYTSDSRTDIFAHRPVPVQVNYLGYPGTMGTEYMDYILADRHVIPESHQQFYSEKVVYLPDSYLPTDTSIQIAERTPSREECGLPPTGIVFCSFSHDYKILPVIFNVWMRLLQQVPGSILWLMSRSDISQRNLRLSAEQRGIDPSRLIFAGRVPLVEDHLARYRLADIFLDTHPYNAHTTAADALMAGLPVVTYMGNAFPARVAGSLLHAIGMPELIAQSQEEYEQIALRLVTTPALLADVKARLVANKANCPLFDTKKFTQNLEVAYIEMHSKTESDDIDLSEKKLSQAPPQLTVLPSRSLDGDLVLAQDLFRQGNLPQAEIYCRRCLGRDSHNLIAIELLAELRRAYGLSESFTLSEYAPLMSNSGNRYLLIKAWGYGFWSDVHHVVTQLLLAELTQRTPIILWGRNCLFRNDSDINAFGHFFQEISTARIDDVPQSATIFPSKWNWNNLYEEDINKWEGEDSRIAAQYLFERPETLLVSDFYSTLSSIIPWISSNSKYYGLSEDALYGKSFQKYLKPTPGITAIVDNFYVQNMQGRPWVAIHVRGSDKIHESPNLSQVNDSYRSFIDRIIELNPTIGVFLLTDSSVVMEEFSKRYGERLLCTSATRVAASVGVHLSGHDGVVIGVEVLVDTLLAIKCDYFVGNQESNVSLAISSLRDWSQGFIFLLGGGNIRGENLFLHNNHARSLDTIQSTTSATNNKTIVPSVKRVIQVFKAPHQWVNSPPGLGDFVRGACHIFERLQGSCAELRIDISQTEFSDLIQHDPSIFHFGEEKRIANAEEYFVDHAALHNRLVSFMDSGEIDLYVCTNLGDWNRLTLPETTREFIQKLYRFTDNVESMTAQALPCAEYEVLSIRCGDHFYSDPASKVRDDLMLIICAKIEQEILPHAQLPIVVTSDCHELKCEIARRYGMLMLPHKSQHGAFGHALPVAMDLCLLKNSKFNYHINSWATWWSGFSHYTSIIFNIPSMNFRAPDFAKEKITAEGLLVNGADK